MGHARDIAANDPWCVLDLTLDCRQTVPEPVSACDSGTYVIKRAPASAINRRKNNGSEHGRRGKSLKRYPSDQSFLELLTHSDSPFKDRDHSRRRSAGYSVLHHFRLRFFYFQAEGGIRDGPGVFEQRPILRRDGLVL